MELVHQNNAVVENESGIGGYLKRSIGSNAPSAGSSGHGTPRTRHDLGTM